MEIIAETVFKNEGYFSGLDAAVGDGDFGATIGKGFRKIAKELKDVNN